MNYQPIIRDTAAILNSTCTRDFLYLWVRNKNFQCEVWYLYYWKFYLTCCLPWCVLALYIDNNDNKTTFLGNIVYLRPCSVIFFLDSHGDITEFLDVIKIFYKFIFKSQSVLVNSYPSEICLVSHSHPSMIWKRKTISFEWLLVISVPGRWR